jgi:hypothetical protein
MLFLTFTVNPLLFGEPVAAFEQARDRLRRLFFKLRRGVIWEGKRYVINAPYAVKVEFHRNGWAHFHVVFLTHRFLPGGLLNTLWLLGRTNVRRISNQKFRYLLKYVTKGGGLPDWVLGRNRLRVFQSSRGFLTANDALAPENSKTPRKRLQRSSTLGARLERWSRTALLQKEECYRQVILTAPFFELVDRLIFPTAMEGRYLGGGCFLINDTNQLEPWIV